MIKMDTINVVILIYSKEVVSTNLHNVLSLRQIGGLTNQDTMIPIFLYV